MGHPPKVQVCSRATSFSFGEEELLKEKGFSIEFQEAFRLNNKKEVDFNYTKLKKYPDLYSHLIHSRVFLKELIELYDALIKDAENTVTVLSDISGVN